jgi:hypothetical protein
VSPDLDMTELEGLWPAVLASGAELSGQTVLHCTNSIAT